MQHHLALYLLYAKLRCKPNSRTKVPIHDDSQKRCVCVYVYVPLMQPHRSTEGNQFTLTSFLHAHSRSRTHTRTHSETCVATTLLTCVCMFVCMYVSATCFFFCCCSCCRCCCFYFPFHEPILTRVLLFQLLTK